MSEALCNVQRVLRNVGRQLVRQLLSPCKQIASSRLAAMMKPEHFQERSTGLPRKERISRWHIDRMLAFLHFRKRRRLNNRRWSRRPPDAHIHATIPPVRVDQGEGRSQPFLGGFESHVEVAVFCAGPSESEADAALASLASPERGGNRWDRRRIDTTSTHRDRPQIVTKHTTAFTPPPPVGVITELSGEQPNLHCGRHSDRACITVDTMTHH